MKIVTEEFEVLLAEYRFNSKEDEEDPKMKAKFDSV